MIATSIIHRHDFLMQCTFCIFICGAELQELALECMAHDPASRPTFQQIEERLTKLQATVQATPGKGFLRSGGSPVEAA